MSNNGQAQKYQVGDLLTVGSGEVEAVRIVFSPEISRLRWQVDQWAYEFPDGIYFQTELEAIHAEKVA